MKFKQAFTTLSNLSFAQLWLLGEIWLVFLKWDLLVSLFHYRYWQLTFDKTTALMENKANFPQVLAIIRLSEKVGRNHLRKMNCLRRCLCQKQLLERRHYPCELHIGVQITDDKLKAHSWLSYNDVLINDSAEIVSQYTELEQSANTSILFALRG
ncbi:MAG: hypothetical protein ACI8Z9_000416 [Paraglaciecola sp.]